MPSHRQSLYALDSQVTRLSVMPQEMPARRVSPTLPANDWLFCYRVPCSCITSGFPNKRAARPITGSKTSNPNTTSGRSRRRIVNACHTAPTTTKVPSTASKRPCHAPLQFLSNAMGSQPVALNAIQYHARFPSQLYRAPWDFNSSATESAGNTCPPVPPAMTTTFKGFEACSLIIRLLITTTLGVVLKGFCFNDWVFSSIAARLDHLPEILLIRLWRGHDKSQRTRITKAINAQLTNKLLPP